jgi:hypothetical protein
MLLAVVFLLLQSTEHDMAKKIKKLYAAANRSCRGMEAYGELKLQTSNYVQAKQDSKFLCRNEISDAKRLSTFRLPLVLTLIYNCTEVLANGI